MTFQCFLLCDGNEAALTTALGGLKDEHWPGLRLAQGGRRASAALQKSPLTTGRKIPRAEWHRKGLTRGGAAAAGDSPGADAKELAPAVESLRRLAVAACRLMPGGVDVVARQRHGVDVFGKLHLDTTSPL
jgi:hypothetical protein